MRRSLALALVLSLFSITGCGKDPGPPNLDLIWNYGRNVETWIVSPDDPFVCIHYPFDVENRDERSYHFTRMYPRDTVAHLSDGAYAFPSVWGWMDAVEDYGGGYLNLEPGEQKDAGFQACLDASPLFGRDVVGGGEGFCEATYDPATGDYNGVTGDMQVIFEGNVAMEGFDEYGNEFGPQGPVPAWLGGTIVCVP